VVRRPSAGMHGLLTNRSPSCHWPLAPCLLPLVVTLTTRQTVRSYPCRSIDKATSPAQRFIAGVVKPATPAAR
jgi:hypothetical protein